MKFLKKPFFNGLTGLNRSHKWTLRELNPSNLTNLFILV